MLSSDLKQFCCVFQSSGGGCLFVKIKVVKSILWGISFSAKEELSRDPAGVEVIECIYIDKNV